jgi:hypothetical protein
MQFIQAIHDWIVAHPVAFPLFLAIGIGIPSSVFSGEIRQFILLPPQKIGIWLLKARINAIRVRAFRVRRMSKSVHYTLYQIFYGIFGILMSIQLMTLLILDRMNGIADPRHANMLAYKIFSFVIPFYLIYSIVFMGRILDLVYMASNYKRAIEHLAVTTVLLQNRLKLSGIQIIDDPSDSSEK